CPPSPDELAVPRRAAMCDAVLMASAAIVNVGGDDVAVTKEPLPTRYRFGTSCARRFGSTTLVRGSIPMRCVPIWCAASVITVAPSYVAPVAPRIFAAIWRASSSVAFSYGPTLYVMCGVGLP